MVRSFKWRSVIIGAIAVVGVGVIAVAQDLKSQSGVWWFHDAAASGVALFQDHGLWRQSGLVMARYTAPDLADKALVMYTYPMAVFLTPELLPLLGDNLKSQEAAIGLKLGSGKYAVMGFYTAKELGAAAWPGVDLLKQVPTNDLGWADDIHVVTSMAKFLGQPYQGKISHWNDPVISPAEFLAEYEAVIEERLERMGK